MNRTLIIAALVLLGACAQSNTPSEGSQTHFLEPCTQSCPEPYACVANACTLECDEDMECSELPGAARCLSPVYAGEGDPNKTVCDVECMDDGDCKTVGTAHDCERGRYMHGTGVGTLTDEQATALAADIGWERIPEWSTSMTEDPGCPDGSTTVLKRDVYATSCTCGCRPEFSPADKIAAFATIGEWMRTIENLSLPLQAEVSAIGYADPNLATLDPLEWTLDRPVLELGFPAPDQGQLLDATPVRFDGADAAQLRSMRENARLQGMGNTFIPVVDEGVTYAIYARDELPEDVVDAIEATRVIP